MAELTRPRRVALDAVRRTRSGDLADRALDRAASGLASRDFGWVQELVYGTARLRGRIDFLLGHLVRGGLDSLEPDVLDVLRLGAYQLLEMGSVPPYAAISQSVELVRAAGAPRAAGLVNGVLNSLQRRKGEIDFPSLEREPLEHLATWGSHPRWLLERWLQRWDAEAVAALVAANNQRPELYLRPIGVGAAAAVERLSDAGIAAEPVPFSPDSIRILPPAGAEAALAAVAAVVQDPAAALVVRHADVPQGSTVLDLCAAPGGKAVAAAFGASYVAAADLSAGRLRRLRDNVDRLELGSRVALVVADARQPPFRPADVVILDAPCTGTGTLRRHPDGRWRIREADLGQLAALQREILDAAAGVVAPGGLLVYSTCSLEPEENQQQVESFLARHPEFRPEPSRQVDDPDLLDPSGHLYVLPQRHGVDGSFAARLRRLA